MLPFLVACTPDPEAQAPALDCGDSCYVLATAVSDADGANTYVKVMDQLLDGELDLAGAREFAGWSDLKVHEGQVFVSSGEAPIVWRFSVGDDGELVEDGEISFANYTNDASMYLHAFVGPDKAYLLGEGGEYVIWNPTTFEITGTIPLPSLDPRDAHAPAPSLDRGMIVRDGLFFHTVAFTDYAVPTMASSSAIVIVDIATDTVSEVVDVDCPDLNIVSATPGGDLVFSNWVYSPAATLVHDDARACLAVIPAGSTELDPTRTRTFEDLTGYEAAAVTVLDGGEAFVSVFVEDHVPFDPATDDVWGWLFGTNWRSYTLDLATGAATEIPSLGWHSGGYYTARLDDTDYLLLPGDGYTTTQVFELTAEGATPRVSMDGWSTRLFQVR